MVWTKAEARFYAKQNAAKRKAKSKRKGAKRKPARKARRAPRARRAHSTKLTKTSVQTMLKGAATLDRNIDHAIGGLQKTKGLLASAAEEYMSGKKNRAARLIARASQSYSACGVNLRDKAPR